METLIINVPEKKSTLIKQILKAFGVTIQKSSSIDKKPSDFVGIISKEKAKELLINIENSRQEWERNI